MRIFSGQRSADMGSSLEGTEMSSDTSFCRTRIRTLTRARFDLRTWTRTVRDGPTIFSYSDETLNSGPESGTANLNFNILQTDSWNTQLVLKVE